MTTRSKSGLGSTTKYLPDATATDALAARCAALLPQDVRGWVILLEGELGSGKSTFARALLQALGVTGAVPSPTYTLVEPYEIGDRKFYHIDLYRISSPDELDFLGWSDMQDGMMLIEWPARVPELMSASDAVLRLTYAGNGRAAELTMLSERARALLGAMA